MMQDLKTGHLLGAAPKAQFYGQMIGSAAGAVVSALVYRLYTSVYEVPGGMFEVPTAYVWIFTARLVTGKGLPEMAGQWVVGAGCVWMFLTGVRVWGRERWWVGWVPGGIAVAVGRCSGRFMRLVCDERGMLMVVQACSIPRLLRLQERWVGS